MQQHNRIWKNPESFILFLTTLFSSLLFFSTSAYAINCGTPGSCQEIATVGGAIGIALDEAHSQLYYVEYNSGTLKRINLPPSCGPGTTTPSCATTITTVASGFTHPEDVRLDVAHNQAYVTTRDDTGTTGAFWRVNLGTGAKTRVTFNLGSPQQIFLDVANNQAFTTGYTDNRLRKIDLTTGAKTPLSTSLTNPIGLVLTQDQKSAYVTSDSLGAVLKVNLSTGVVEASAAGFSVPFFLAWTDDTQSALYVPERVPGNKVSRLDLTTLTKSDAVTGLPFRPTSVATNGSGNTLYVSTESKLYKINMMSFDLSQPVFLGVGRIPATNIASSGATMGLANTPAASPMPVKDTPFGGTLDIFGNLNNFKNMGASYYEVVGSTDGVNYSSMNLSWNTYKWDATLASWVLTPIAPAATTVYGGQTHYLYAIPAEYPVNPQLWYPSFLMMRWPSGANGMYWFQVNIYNNAKALIPGVLPAGKNLLTLLVDTTPVNVKVTNICQKGVAALNASDPCYPDKEVAACDIITTGNPDYYFKITVNDPNGHLLSYGLTAMYGDNQSSGIYSDNYNNHLGGAPIWSGVINAKVPAAVWHPACNCAHTFYIGAWKRTIDGYGYIGYYDGHKSATLSNAGAICH